MRRGGVPALTGAHPSRGSIRAIPRPRPFPWRARRCAPRPDGLSLPQNRLGEGPGLATLATTQRLHRRRPHEGRPRAQPPPGDGNRHARHPAAPSCRRSGVRARPEGTVDREPCGIDHAPRARATRCRTHRPRKREGAHRSLGCSARTSSRFAGERRERRAPGGHSCFRTFPRCAVRGFTVMIAGRRTGWREIPISTPHLFRRRWNSHLARSPIRGGLRAHLPRNPTPTRRHHHGHVLHHRADLPRPD
jgi:hypothetical protein